MVCILIRLVGFVQVLNLVVMKYMVLGVMIIVVRYVYILNLFGFLVDFILLIGIDVVGIWLFDGFLIVVDLVYEYFCYYVFDVVEIIQVFVGMNNILIFMILGDEYVQVWLFLMLRSFGYRGIVIC